MIKIAKNKIERFMIKCLKFEKEHLLEKGGDFIMIDNYKLNLEIDPYKVKHFI
ncbi:hypothetical protein GCM10008015_09930 [Flavobacterium palustre]|uniref:Uncharacterized protein n=1 Tax=Flavobacterium palustre TaxID=1476463 RepID=A0ABQ1HCM1_9FLAO|nr:hypothetical protein GCM10008015_09930 [Flavobacterium palustre]